MVETTRTPYIPFSFGDLMEGRMRRVGDPQVTGTQRSATAASNRATDTSAPAAGGRGSEGADFQRDLRDALQDSPSGRPAAATSPAPAADGSSGSASAAAAAPGAAPAAAAAGLSDGEIELRNKLAKVVGASSSQVSVKELPSQDTGRTTGTRQYIVTVDPPGSGGPAEAIGVNHELSLPLAEDAADFNYDAISMVKDRLDKMGINSSGIQFEYWNDDINNVGGHRTFHYLSADLGNGVKENFSLEWTLYNPNVTAVEIARLMKMGGGSSVS
ncbi:MAG: hypothetical protein ABI972_12490 [Acidobacteriota bacterium]